jgi:hypothetical protein
MRAAGKPVIRADVCMMFAKSAILQRWHWFAYHFSTLNVPGWEHPLAAPIIDALADCDRAMPGYAQIFITRLAASGGKEKYLPHYEQLLRLGRVAPSLRLSPRQKRAEKIPRLPFGTRASYTALK